MRKLAMEIRWGGTNVINYFQVIQSDFARLEWETTAAESETIHTFNEFTGKAEVTRAASTQEIEYKTQIPTVIRISNEER